MSKPDLPLPVWENTWENWGYPDNWQGIANVLKEWAGRKCEHCGQPNVYPSYVLTVHHLNGDKADCRFENIVALCQACHLHIQGKYFVGKDHYQAWLLGKPEWVTIRGL